LYIQVKVKTGLKKEEINQKDDNHFEISVKEKAERNLANNRVVELIALYFKVPKSQIKIINGHHSPTKLLSIRDGE